MALPNLRRNIFEYSSPKFILNHSGSNSKRYSSNFNIPHNAELLESKDFIKTPRHKKSQSLTIAYHEELNRQEQDLDLFEINLHHQSLQGNQHFKIYKNYLETIAQTIRFKDDKLARLISKGLKGIEKALLKINEEYSSKEKLSTTVCIKTDVITTEVGVQKDEEINLDELTTEGYANIKGMSNTFKKIKLSRVCRELAELHEGLSKMHTEIPSISATPDLKPIESIDSQKIINMKFTVIKENVNRILKKAEKPLARFKVDKETQADFQMKNSIFIALEAMNKDKEIALFKLKSQYDILNDKNLKLEESLIKSNNTKNEYEIKITECEIELNKLKDLNKELESNYLVAVEKNKIFESSIGENKSLIQQNAGLKIICAKKHKELQEALDKIYDLQIVWRIAEKKLSDIEKAYKSIKGSSFQHHDINIDEIKNKFGLKRIILQSLEKEFKDLEDMDLNKAGLSKQISKNSLNFELNELGASLNGVSELSRNNSGVSLIHEIHCDDALLEPQKKKYKQRMSRMNFEARRCIESSNRSLVYDNSPQKNSATQDSRERIISNQSEIGIIRKSEGVYLSKANKILGEDFKNNIDDEIEISLPTDTRIKDLYKAAELNEPVNEIYQAVSTENLHISSHFQKLEPASSQLNLKPKLPISISSKLQTLPQSKIHTPQEINDSIKPHINSNLESSVNYPIQISPNSPKSNNLENSLKLDSMKNKPLLDLNLSTSYNEPINEKPQEKIISPRALDPLSTPKIFLSSVPTINTDSTMTSSNPLSTQISSRNNILKPQMILPDIPSDPHNNSPESHILTQMTIEKIPLIKQSMPLNHNTQCKENTVSVILQTFDNSWLSTLDEEQLKTYHMLKVMEKELKIFNLENCSKEVQCLLIGAEKKQKERTYFASQKALYSDVIEKVFENEGEIDNMPEYSKVKIFKALVGHKKEKCKEVCDHLRRVMKIKWKVRGVAYPVKVIKI